VMKLRSYRGKKRGVKPDTGIAIGEGKIRTPPTTDPDPPARS